MTEPVFTPSNPDLSDLMGVTPPAEKKPVPRAALVTGAVVGGLLLAGGGFFAGQATASSGPATLAEAVTMAQSGKLACGSSTGIVTRLCSSTGTGAAGPGGYGFGAAPGGAGGTGTGAGGTGTGQRGGNAAGQSALAALLGAGAVGGPVTSVDGTTLTLTTRGGTVTYTLPSSAAVTKTQAGSVTDLLAGETVYVQATTDSAGKATVTKLFLVPAAG